VYGLQSFTEKERAYLSLCIDFRLREWCWEFNEVVVAAREYRQTLAVGSYRPPCSLEDQLNQSCPDVDYGASFHQGIRSIGSTVASVLGFIRRNPDCIVLASLTGAVILGAAWNPGLHATAAAVVPVLLENTITTCSSAK
jgi:hypothetical protein